MAFQKTYTATLAFILFFAVSILPASAAEKIAVILNAEVAPYQEVLDGLRSEGKGRISTDVFDLAGMDAGEIAKSIEKGRYRVVVAVGPKALEVAASAKGAILTCMVNDPGRVLGSQRTDFTGIRMSIPAYSSLRALRQVIPSVKRVGIVFNEKTTSSLAAEAMRDASSQGITIVQRTISRPGEAIDAYSSLVGHVDAILLLPDPLALANPVLDELLAVSYKHRLPLVGFSFKYVKEGALLALSYEPRDVGADLAEMAINVLSGKAPSATTLSPVSRLTLHINSRTAERMGIAIAPALRDSARIYQP